MSNEQTSATARDTALASVPPEKREALLRKASDLGVHGSDDVIWALVAAVITTQVNVEAASTAARETGTAIAGIRDVIYQGASKASADIRATIETSITGTVSSAVAAAAQAGADAFRKAAADLPAMARQEQGRIVQEWRSALTEAARGSAFAGFFQRLSVNVLALTLIVAGIFVGGLVAGGAGIEAVMTMQHRLTPGDYRLLVTPQGKPECGVLGGHTVCLARRARHL